MNAVADDFFFFLSFFLSFFEKGPAAEATDVPQP
jgi:hypothetical protein